MARVRWDDWWETWADGTDLSTLSSLQPPQ